MNKTAIARQKRNKKIYKKLSMSLRKIVRKTKKVLAFRKRTSRKMVQQSNHRFEKMSFKFATFILLIAMGAVTLSTSRTNSFYNDIENSVGNVFQASTLGIGVSGEFVSGIVRLGEATTTDIVLSKSDTNDLDYQYFASTTLMGSDTLACDYITISASSSPQDYVDVPLKDFISATSTPMDPNQWDFIFAVASDTPDSVIGKICNFKISYTAWQTNLPDNSGGFSDIAEINGSIEIGPLTPPVASGVVLNEFLPRPHDDGGIKPDGEWVELYNLSATETIDLVDYYLKDNLNPTSGPSHKINIENCRTNTGGTTIGPKGFLVVYARGDNGSCNSHGFELNNAGDTVRLFNNNDQMIDSYSYDGSVYCSLTSTPGNPNIDDSSLGSCPGVVPQNKSFARIPDGTDNWIDPIPTPGEPNKVEETVVETSVISNEVLGGGSSGSGASDVVQDTGIAETTPPIIETQPSPDASADTEVMADTTTASEAEPATAQTAPEEPAILDGASTESSGDSTEASSESPAVIPSEPEGPVVSEPQPSPEATAGETEPVVVPEPAVEAAPVVEPPAADSATSSQPSPEATAGQAVEPKPEALPSESR